MKRASQLFNEEQASRINRAVQEAESCTSAEIVPVVATASGRYDRPEDIVGLWLAVITAAIVYLAFPQVREAEGSWGGIHPAWKLVAVLAGIVVGFVAGAVAATHIGWLRRLCTSRRQMRDEVERGARGAFFDNRIHRTAGATGLVVYVSLYERMATVVADETVTEKLGQAALDELCTALTSGLKAGRFTDAICETLRAAGERLGQVLPRADDDVNELPDALVTVD